MTIFFCRFEIEATFSFEIKLDVAVAEIKLALRRFFVFVLESKIFLVNIIKLHLLLLSNVYALNGTLNKRAKPKLFSSIDLYTSFLFKWIINFLKHDILKTVLNLMIVFGEDFIMNFKLWDGLDVMLSFLKILLKIVVLDGV